ncbi:hypothetical protein QBC33DRAFT_572002 [Phialemonium atrogriseum]|uniref:Uncharacterized protein n=1 Tax=Phialemonium atrogriseum TaxID=1093897 RepID=A0AAJ0BZN9_9PEZI|nr:uncharacterized protein QBC33DRAFT_572002 [Phialemonium atrogriseum]KAK1765021.1 hypothetical protein QBC33DRAFT_572002 [Phialemonium atrogriseum]
MEERLDTWDEHGLEKRGIPIPSPYRRPMCSSRPDFGWSFTKSRHATPADIAHIPHHRRLRPRGGVPSTALASTAFNLHTAHGYLLAQFFLSGNDSLAQPTAAVDPGFVVSVKLNGSDFQDDGFRLQEASELMALLQGARVDIVERSGGHV